MDLIYSLLGVFSKKKSSENPILEAATSPEDQETMTIEPTVLPGFYMEIPISNRPYDLIIEYVDSNLDNSSDIDGFDLCSNVENEDVLSSEEIADFEGNDLSSIASIGEGHTIFTNPQLAFDETNPSNVSSISGDELELCSELEDEYSICSEEREEFEDNCLSSIASIDEGHTIFTNPQLAFDETNPSNISSISGDSIKKSAFTLNSFFDHNNHDDLNTAMILDSFSASLLHGIVVPEINLPILEQDNFEENRCSSLYPKVQAVKEYLDDGAMRGDYPRCFSPIQTEHDHSRNHEASGSRNVSSCRNLRFSSPLLQGSGCCFSPILCPTSALNTPNTSLKSAKLKKD